jgi:hypothetical protein
MHYEDGYKYRIRDKDVIFVLPEEFTGYSYSGPYMILTGGVLTLKIGYACDGPSGPTWDSKSGMRGAFLHDALYQLLREEVIPRTLKPLVDDLFHQLLVHDGMNKLRAWYWHRAVKRMGHSATITNRDIKRAP